MKRGKLKKSKISGENGHSSQSHKLTSEGSTPSSAPIAKPVAPFSFRVTVHENTRLRVGDVIHFDGVRQVVCQVNSSSARITPLGATTKTVTFTPRFKDTPVTFNAPVPTTVTSISANSECDILERLGRNWKEKLGVNPKG